VCFWFNDGDTCVKTEADNPKTAKNEAGMYHVNNVPFDSDVKVTANFTQAAVADNPNTEADESKAAVAYFPYEATFWTGGEAVIGGGDEVAYQVNTQQEWNFTMVAANYTLEAYVYADGEPAAGATVVLDLRDSIDWNEGFPIYQTAVADADGKISIPGLPASSLELGIDYEIWVLPFDKDGDGMADFEAVWRDFDPFWDSPDKFVFNLRHNDGSLDAIYSNVEDGTHTSDAPIEVVFDQVINEADVNLYDQRIDNVAVTFEIVGGIKLVITPVLPLGAASDYELDICARNTANHNEDCPSYFFSVGDNKTVAPITGLALQDPTETFDSDRSFFDLTWTTDQAAIEYCVYATNNGEATDWNQIACFSGGGNASRGLAMQEHRVFIPDENVKFDTIKGDAEFTTLEGGTEITFVVTGKNFDDEESPIAGAATLTVADTEGPDLTFGPNQSGSADNTGGTAATTVEIFVGFSEYMDRTTAPTITFTDGGVVAGAPSGATWTWDNDGQGGKFEFSVAAGADNSDDTYAINFAGVTDTSGNEFDEDLDGGTAGVQIKTGDIGLF